MIRYSIEAFPAPDHGQTKAFPATFTATKNDVDERGKCGQIGKVWESKKSGSPPIANLIFFDSSVAQKGLFFPISPFLLHSSLSHIPHIMAARSPITCHVLDSSVGRPGRNVPVKLELLNAAANNTWAGLATG